MNLSERLAAAGLAAFLVALATSTALPQSRTLKIVVPYTPGSGPDIVSRLMAEQIGRAQGPNVLVENRPGGGTVIGTEWSRARSPTATRVLLVGNSFVVNPALKRAAYDVTTSFAPVC